MTNFGGIQASSLANLMRPQHADAAGANGGAAKAADVEETARADFGGALTKAIGALNETQVAGDTAARDVAAGRTDDLSGALLKIEQAEISLQLATSIRNRAIEAYQEIMRMQV